MSGQYEWKVGQPLPVLGAHSVAKHDIFEQYVGIYIERLTRTPSQTMLNLTIVDGFSGGGLYRQGLGEVDGSPLRLLTAVEAADKSLNAARAKGFTVRADFFFIDENPHHVAFLIDVLRKRGYGSRLGQDIFVRQASFDEACPDVLAHIQKKGTAHRSLFFLDQYGWSDVRLQTIRTILSTLKNPEILLTFAVDALIDFLSVKTAETQALLNIELDREDVRELMDLRTGDGWRYLIQNGLYRHIQARTGSRFYTPFFIHSVEAHRSYWLLHLSNHRQARDEMGKLHWRLNNRFQHHGGAGFHALGFDPSRDLRQGLLTFMFDDDAMKRSEAAVLEQLPRMIHAANRDNGGLLVEELFAGNCNDTPVTSDILGRQLVFLRDEGELTIVTPDGSTKPRTKNVDWGDRLILPRERSLFSRLGWEKSS
ncbi:three-Cys-motif partner protein TcmP [Leptospira interrogans]